MRSNPQNLMSVDEEEVKVNEDNVPNHPKHSLGFAKDEFEEKDANVKLNAIMAIDSSIIVDDNDDDDENKDNSVLFKIRDVQSAMKIIFGSDEESNGDLS